MFPICCVTSSSSHFQICFHGGFRPLSPQGKYFGLRCMGEDTVFFRFSADTHLQGDSFAIQTAKSNSFYSNFVETCQNELKDLHCKGSNAWTSKFKEALIYVENSSVSAEDQGIVYPVEQLNGSGNIVEPAVPESISNTDILQDNSASVSSTKTDIEDLFSGVSESIGSSVNSGESIAKSSLDTITSSVTSISKSANEAIYNAASGIVSTVNQTGDLAGDRLASFSNNLKDTTSDVLRNAIEILENSIKEGASFVVYSYGSGKELLPAGIRNILNFSEEKVIDILTPIISVFQQVLLSVEGLEKSLGLDPDDPFVPFVLFLVISATVWVSYWVWKYGGYSGDLSPQLTLELLTGKGNFVLVDVRPEAVRERDGIPDLRRAARFRYASVTLPEVDGSVRKLLKSGRALDDTLVSAVIKNLKIVQSRSKVIIMDVDGTHSKNIAKSLRKLGVKETYLVQDGFQSWVKRELRIKELKPETALTILNEDAEAILEAISPSPLQIFGYGMGFLAGLYALQEWEKTLQLIGVLGLGQTIYRRVASYEDSEDFQQDLRLLLAPVRLGAQSFSWAAGKLETTGIGLPMSPSSKDVQNRVLQAAAKHESQPSDTEGIQDPSLESILPVKESIDISEA